LQASLKELKATITISAEWEVTLKQRITTLESELATTKTSGEKVTEESSAVGRCRLIRV
jgi:hypothetical protein